MAYMVFLSVLSLSEDEETAIDDINVQDLKGSFLPPLLISPGRLWKGRA